MAVIVSVLIIVLSYVIYRIDRPCHAERIIDGETIVFEGGKEIELLGVNLSGSDNSIMAAEYLKTIIDGRNVWLEYDFRNRNGAWVWVGCESAPKLLISNLRGTDENPIGCQKGVLVNEQLVKMGWSKPISADEATGKYKMRLQGLGESG